MIRCGKIVNFSFYPLVLMNNFNALLAARIIVKRFLHELRSSVNFIKIFGRFISCFQK